MMTNKQQGWGGRGSNGGCNGRNFNTLHQGLWLFRRMGLFSHLLTGLGSYFHGSLWKYFHITNKAERNHWFELDVHHQGTLRCTFFILLDI